MSKIAKQLINNMTDDFKEEALARFFYYLDNDTPIYFDDADENEREFCRFISHRYMSEKKIDRLIMALIDLGDSDYIKAVEGMCFIKRNIL